MNKYLPFDEHQLSSKISNLTNWLHEGSGLGMKSTIDTILDSYKEPLTGVEMDEVMRGVEIIKNTTMSGQLTYFMKKLDEFKIVKRGDEWSPVNKINTNYSSLSKMLVELIKRGYNNSDRGKLFYTELMNGDIKTGLMRLKPYMIDIINRYFLENGKGIIEEFENFTDSITRSTRIGNYYEDRVSNKLEKSGFDIVWRGHDGNPIDMILGIDMIVWRDDFGYITIQIKSNIDWQRIKNYRKVDWIVDGSADKIYDEFRKEVLKL
jgi:hypothetical protein